jgi:hypothetical protein
MGRARSEGALHIVPFVRNRVVDAASTMTMGRYRRSGVDASTKRHGDPCPL